MAKAKPNLRVLPVTTLRPLPSQPIIDYMARELIAPSDAYYWDAQRTVGQPHAILQYTVRGEGRLTYRGKTYRLTPGTAFFVHNMDPELAYYSYPESGQEWEILWCNVRPGEALAADLIARHGPVYSIAPDSWFLGQLRHYLYSRLDFVQLKLADSLRLMAGLLIELAESSARVASDAASGHLIQAFCELVHTRLAYPLTVADAASHLRVSREHLTRMCQEQLHITPAAYINQAKMREAITLLQNPQHIIKQVAHNLGYEHTSHFSRVFRRLVGVSPRAFRDSRQHHPISPLLGEH